MDGRGAKGLVGRFGVGGHAGTAAGELDGDGAAGGRVGGAVVGDRGIDRDVDEVDSPARADGVPVGNAGDEPLGRAADETETSVPDALGGNEIGDGRGGFAGCVDRDDPAPVARSRRAGEASGRRGGCCGG